LELRKSTFILPLRTVQEEEIDIVARTADGELIRRSKESEDVVLVSLDDLMK